MKYARFFLKLLKDFSLKSFSFILESCLLQIPLPLLKKKKKKKVLRKSKETNKKTIKKEENKQTNKSKTTNHNSYL